MHCTALITLHVEWLWMAEQIDQQWGGRDQCCSSPTRDDHRQTTWWCGGNTSYPAHAKTLSPFTHCRWNGERRWWVKQPDYTHGDSTAGDFRVVFDSWLLESKDWWKDRKWLHDEVGFLYTTPCEGEATPGVTIGVLWRKCTYGNPVGWTGWSNSDILQKHRGVPLFDFCFPIRFTIRWETDMDEFEIVCTCRGLFCCGDIIWHWCQQMSTMANWQNELKHKPRHLLQWFIQPVKTETIANKNNLDALR